MGAVIGLATFAMAFGGGPVAMDAVHGGKPFGAPLQPAALVDTNFVPVRLDRETAPVTAPADGSADVLSRLSRDAIRSSGPVVQPAPADPTPVAPSRAAAMAGRARRAEDAGAAASGWGWLADEVAASRRNDGSEAPSADSWPDLPPAWRRAPATREREAATGFDFSQLVPSLTPGRSPVPAWPWERTPSAATEQPPASPWPQLTDPWSAPLQGPGKR
jgi:hypothetical protein